jgi:hypothetical protein
LDTNKRPIPTTWVHNLYRKTNQGVDILGGTTEGTEPKQDIEEGVAAVPTGACVCASDLHWNSESSSPLSPD